MGNFIRSISSLIGGRPGALLPTAGHASPGTDGPEAGAAPTSATPHADSTVPAQDDDLCASGSQRSLPLVAYAVESTELAPSRLRRSRNVSLLRQSGAVA